MLKLYNLGTMPIIIFLVIILLCVEDCALAGTEKGNIPVRQTTTQNKSSSIFTPSSIKLLSEYYNNSSNFRRKGIGTEFGLFAASGLYLEAGYVFLGFSRNGFEDITRHTLFIQGEKQVSEKTRILIRMSENYYDNDNVNLNAGLFIRYRLLTNVFTEFSLRRFDIIDTVLPFNNAIYSYVATMGALVHDIQSDDYKIYSLYTPVPNAALAGEFVYGDYSDGNKKQSLMFEAGYQLLDMPYLRAAYNYFYLNIKDPAPLVQKGSIVESAYWDPVNFETHTLRLEFRKACNKNLLFGAETALSYSPKSDGLSKAAFLSASYRLTKPLSLSFDVRWFDQNKGIDRLGETGRYWATNYNIGLKYRF